MNKNLFRNSPIKQYYRKHLIKPPDGVLILNYYHTAALFSHGTLVAMFSQKCRAGISVSKIGMGRDPKRKNIKQKIPKEKT